MYDTKHGNNHNKSPGILSHYLIIKCRIFANHRLLKGRISQLSREYQRVVLSLFVGVPSFVFLYLYSLTIPLNKEYDVCIF